MIRRAGFASLAAALAACGWAASSAFAQTAAPAQPAATDPIGALLQRQAGVETEEPDEAAEPRQAPAARPAPNLPPGLDAAAYESRVRASWASAQSFQGPLDGGWTLAAASGPLYALQLADRGRGSVEGAWRDLRRPGALDASGLIDPADDAGAEVTLRLGGGVATLRRGADGRWAGTLDEAGRTQAVNLSRRNP